MKNLSLYIHIPYCERKCYYCDFTSFANKNKDIDLYINNLIRELSIYKEKIKDFTIETIFIGGGTPSSVDANYIKQVLDYIYQNFNTNLNEVTIEANPGTLSLYKLRQYISMGINRISLGVQSSSNNLLKSIGRIHTWEDFLFSLKLIRKSGFENINVDLMFGLPDQTLKDVENTLNEIIKLNIPHISFYSLIVEENTLMNKWLNQGLIKLPDENLEREMYNSIIETLKANKYIHYEISNFAKEGYQCEHNLTYWKVKPYLGVGLSSHSNLFNKRFWNYSDMKSYNEALNQGRLPVEGEEEIDFSMEIAEYCIMGLRLIKGIDKEKYKHRFKEDIKDRYFNVIQKHIQNGLISEDDKTIKLTRKGLDLSNLVEVDFMP